MSGLFSEKISPSCSALLWPPLLFPCPCYLLFGVTNRVRSASSPPFPPSPPPHHPLPPSPGETRGLKKNREGIRKVGEDKKREGKGEEEEEEGGGEICIAWVGGGVGCEEEEEKRRN